VPDDAPLDPRLRYAGAPRLPEGHRLDVRSLLDQGCEIIELEVGPGRGGFLIERLAARPDVGLVGLEVKRKWVTLVNERLQRLGFGTRGRVFADDVRLALPRLGPDGALAAAYFHFPDPWWKKRHKKRLVIATPLLDEVARLLRPSGELFIQTDVEERAELYETQILGHASFEAFGDSADGVDARASARLAENPYGARSHRERRAIDDAIPIYRLRFRRVDR
jgi:tRNA (guanine-N7-)-methyltransferase